jgi:hypothetical protein
VTPSDAASPLHSLPRRTKHAEERAAVVGSDRGPSFLFAAPAHAQVYKIPGSGCPNSTFGLPSGNATIGNPWAYRCDPCRPNQAAFVIVGVPGANVAFNQPLTCVPGPCVLACDPILAVPDGWSVQIPLDRTLIGVCLCVQCACVDRSVPCFTLAGAAQVCIQ